MLKKKPTDMAAKEKETANDTPSDETAEADAIDFNSLK